MNGPTVRQYRMFMAVVAQEVKRQTLLARGVPECIEMYRWIRTPFQEVSDDDEVVIDLMFEEGIREVPVHPQHKGRVPAMMPNTVMHTWFDYWVGWNDEERVAVIACGSATSPEEDDAGDRSPNEEVPS